MTIFEVYTRINQEHRPAVWLAIRNAPYNKGGEKLPNPAYSRRLTLAEVAEVHRRLADQEANSEIAAALNITPQAVSYYRRNPPTKKEKLGRCRQDGSKKRGVAILSPLDQQICELYYTRCSNGDIAYSCESSYTVVAQRISRLKACGRLENIDRLAPTSGVVKLLVEAYKSGEIYREIGELFGRSTTWAYSQIMSLADAGILTLRTTSDRDERVKQLFDAGKTLREIGESVDPKICRERVRQILAKRFGVKRSDKPR